VIIPKGFTRGYLGGRGEVAQRRGPRPRRRPGGVGRAPRAGQEVRPRRGGPRLQAYR
jgi:hypothetical protein